MTKKINKKRESEFGSDRERKGNKVKPEKE